MASRDQFTEAHDRDLIANAIATLSADHQIVITLRYYGDLPIDEIARRLNIPAGTVQSRLHYALKHLHASISRAEREGNPR